MDDRRALVEDLPRLDASDLGWSGILDQPWRLGTSSHEPWPWSELAAAFAGRDGAGHAEALLRAVASRPVAHGPDRITVDVEFEVLDPRVRELEGGHVTRQLEIVATCARYGGARLWFRCGGCNSRRAFLYPTATFQWACRECLGLTYRSRAKFGRPWRRGRAAGAMEYAIERFEAHKRRVARASYRRRVSRDRQRYRDDGETAATWPIALTGYGRVATDRAGLRSGMGPEVRTP